MRFFFAAIGFSILAACAPEPPLVFDIDPAFTPIEHFEIWQAAAKWNAVSIRPISFGTGAWRIIKGSPAWPYDGLTCRDDDSDICGGDDTILIKYDMQDARLNRAILHEFGHTLGLSHTSGGVMNWADLGNEELTEVDLQECRRVGACL